MYQACSPGVKGLTPRYKAESLTRLWVKDRQGKGELGEHGNKGTWGKRRDHGSKEAPSLPKPRAGESKKPKEKQKAKFRISPYIPGTKSFRSMYPASACSVLRRYTIRSASQLRPASHRIRKRRRRRRRRQTRNSVRTRTQAGRKTSHPVSTKQRIAARVKINGEKVLRSGAAAVVMNPAISRQECSSHTIAATTTARQQRDKGDSRRREPRQCSVTNIPNITARTTTAAR